jgi:hypothetical protein
MPAGSDAFQSKWLNKSFGGMGEMGKGLAYYVI